MISDLFQRPPVALELREYQHRAVAEVDQAFAAGARAPLLVAPTGSGKTVIGAELIRLEVSAGGRVLFIAPRRELIHQSSHTLRDAGISHGVILAAADHLHAPGATVHVASLDTLQSRIERRGLLSKAEVAPMLGVSRCLLGWGRTAVLDEGQDATEVPA